MTLPDEVEEFIRNTRKRAAQLAWEWRRIEMGSQWCGGLRDDAKQQVEALRRIEEAAADGR